MTPDELKQFKASLSITTVAQALGIDVVHGKCRCLFPERHTHGDRTPSVSISEERGFFRCWVCQDVRGDVINLVQLSKDCSFVEALQWLQEMFPFLAGNASNRRDLPRNESQRKDLPRKQDSTQVRPVYARNTEVLSAGQKLDENQRTLELEPPKELIPEEERRKIILSFLKMLSPVENTPAAAWLVKRRIYKPVWDKMRLRTIVNYEALNKALKENYSLDVLKYVGLFNDKGNLRYYKHPLIFPYLDEQMRSFYFQARAIDSTVTPKELNLRGTVPYPYNMAALNQKTGWVYLCEGVVDTLTFIGQKVNAIGIPGVRSFKVEWVPLFKNKNVVLCLDKDEAGRSGTEYLQKVFSQAGIRSVVLGTGTEHLASSMKEGEDINDWFGGKK